MERITQTVIAYKSRRDYNLGNPPIDIQFCVNNNVDNAENFRKHYAHGVLSGLRVRYAHPCVIVREELPDEHKAYVSEVYSL